ncbi:YcaO-like family protein [Entomobacter blattae]|uniref:YcaO cyclodehydratase, ATP-ad Mg2+-binding n=1 Tax=Entomobacter blattae TaxID=2762277 RepID=A0A7H1NSP9_9PROT|nr:YcaO-like family protein [Entomobacter blattae]QNT78809.1 YcaO cyclodehydratase, ATP-ad Mg2+-binding [Entomobacter blattae]
MNPDKFIKRITQDYLAPPLILGEQLYPDFFSGDIGNINQTYVTQNGQHNGSYVFVDNNSELSGTGVSKDPKKALLKACMEGLERYSSTVLDPKDIIFSSGKNLNNHMSMDNIPLFSQNELTNYSNITGQYQENEEIRWVLGYSCRSKKRVFLPLVMAYFLQNRFENEKFCLPISTGVAAHFSRDEAIQRAILEIIERDVISTVWLANIALPKLELSSDLSRDVIEIIENSYQIGRPITVFVNLGEFSIPTFYAVKRNPDHFQLGTIVGCSTNSDINQGILKAISEVFCVEIALENMITQNDIVAKTPYDCIKIHDGALYTGQSIYNFAFDFLLNSNDKITYSDINKHRIKFQTTKELIDHLISKGLDIYLRDLTTDDIRDFGVYVIRAIIPELMPFSSVMKARYLGSQRLYNVANSYHKSSFCEEDVNPFPQPFA